MSRKRALLAICAVLAFYGLAYWRIKNNPRDPISNFASRLDSVISAKRIEDQIAELASKPHRAGTPENQRVGDAILRRLHDLNLNVTTADYDVPLYQPLENRLYLTAPDSQEFSLNEKAFPEDPYSRVADTETPFFAYSPDADLEAQVIYANYGTREDYASLKKHGQQIAGRIVLVRAQGICRSMKALIAKEEGIAGLLLYPDLRDQGVQKAPFPNGPFLNPWVVQRGSLLEYFSDPSNPLQTLPKVPALPISLQVATEIFKRLPQSEVPADWQGFIRMADANAPVPHVRLVIRGKTETRKIRNIFGALVGTNKLEPAIMLGSHYDAWVYGACDPASGTAVVLEAAKALARLHEQGWQPRRTITFAFWDAEEAGLLGSGRWARENARAAQNVAIQIYVDSLRAQNFTAYISPGLSNALEEVLKRVKDPNQDRPISEIHGLFDLPGFSDDTSPFTGFLGTPTARLGFGTYYSVYHSLYDDLIWMSKFNDPGYRYSASLAKVLGLYLYIFTDPQVLPFQLSEISRKVSDKISNEAMSYPLLQAEVDRFDRVARQLEDHLRDIHELPNQAALEINRDLLAAFLSFSDQTRPFQERNSLIGPSSEEGCNGELLPLLENAKRKQDSVKMNEEVGKLVEAFARARHLIEHAQKTLDQAASR